MRIYLEGFQPNQILLALNKEDSHHLSKVLRVKIGGKVSVFNHIHGEWEALVDSIDKKGVTLKLGQQIRSPEEPSSQVKVGLCFALIKGNALHNVVRQATEIGVDIIQPMITEFTVVDHYNSDKWYAWVREAAEQSERLELPIVKPAIDFKAVESKYPDYTILMADESLAKNLGRSAFKGFDRESIKQGVLLLVGPEGGFSTKELDNLFPRISLGRNILKVDTAVVAALTHLKIHVGG